MVFTLAQEIREKDKDVPIIFLTAKALKEDVLKGYKVGADDYLNKPFDSEVLLLKIQAIIQRKTVESVADLLDEDFEALNKVLEVFSTQFSAKLGNEGNVKAAKKKKAAKK